MASSNLVTGAIITPDTAPSQPVLVIAAGSKVSVVRGTRRGLADFTAPLISSDYEVTQLSGASYAFAPSAGSLTDNASGAVSLYFLLADAVLPDTAAFLAVLDSDAAAFAAGTPKVARATIPSYSRGTFSLLATLSTSLATANLYSVAGKSWSTVTQAVLTLVPHLLVRDASGQARLVMRAPLSRISVSDRTAPDFAGFSSSVAAAHAVQLLWAAATDGRDAAVKLTIGAYLTDPGSALSAAQVKAGTGSFTPVSKVLLPDSTAVRSYTYGAGSLGEAQLIDGKAHYFRAVPEDAAGNLGVVRSLTVTTLDVTPPTFVTFTKGTPTPSTVPLSWTAVTDNADAAPDVAIAAYSALQPGLTAAELLAGKAAGGSTTGFVSKVLLTDGKSVASFEYGAGTLSEGALVQGSTYYFYAVARDVSGNNSSVLGAITASIPDVLPPTLTAITAATATTNSAVTLTASGVSDNVPGLAISICVVACLSSSAPASLTATDVFTAATSAISGFSARQTFSVAAGASTSTFSFVGLAEGTRYKFFAAPKDFAGNYGPVVTAVKLVDATAPVLLSADVLDGVSAGDLTFSASIVAKDTYSGRLSVYLVVASATLDATGAAAAAAAAGFEASTSSLDQTAYTPASSLTASLTCAKYWDPTSGGSGAWLAISSASAPLLLPHVLLRDENSNVTLAAAFCIDGTAGAAAHPSTAYRFRASSSVVTGVSTIVTFVARLILTATASPLAATGIRAAFTGLETAATLSFGPGSAGASAKTSLAVLESSGYRAANGSTVAISDAVSSLTPYLVVTAGSDALVAWARRYPNLSVTDVTAPTFSSLSVLTAASSTVQLSWGSVIADGRDAAPKLHIAAFTASQGSPTAATVKASVAGTGGCVGKVSVTTAGSTTSYVFGSGSRGESALPDGKPYYFYAAAEDATGNLSAVRTVSATTLDVTPPTFVSFAVGTPGTTSVPLSWTAVTDNADVAPDVVIAAYSSAQAGITAATLLAAAAGSGGCVGKVTLADGKTVNSLTFGAGANGEAALSVAVSYYFYAVARDASDNRSSVLSAVGTTADPIPPTFTTFSVGAPAKSSVPMSWTAANDNFDTAPDVVIAAYSSAQAGISAATVAADSAGAGACVGKVTVADGKSVTSLTFGAGAYGEAALAEAAPFYFYAVARDTVGNFSGVLSASATTLDGTAPLWSSLTATGSTSGILSFAYSATDGVAVSAIDFYANGTLLGSIAPGTASASGTKDFGVASGSYSAYAIARDAAGNARTSATVSGLTVSLDRTVTVNGISGGQYYWTKSANDRWSAALSGGQVVNVWVSHATGGSIYGVFAQVVSATGALLTPVTTILDDGVNSYVLPTVCALDNGAFVIAHQLYSSGATNLYYAICSFTGSAITFTNYTLGTQTQDVNAKVTVRRFDGTRFILAWVDYYLQPWYQNQCSNCGRVQCCSNNQVGWYYYYDVRYNILDTSNVSSSSGSVFENNDTNGNVQKVCLADVCVTANTFVFVWQYYDQIYARGFTSSTYAGLWGTIDVDNSSYASLPNWPSAYPFPMVAPSLTTDNVIISWFHNTYFDGSNLNRVLISEVNSAGAIVVNTTMVNPASEEVVTWFNPGRARFYQNAAGGYDMFVVRMSYDTLPNRDVYRYRYTLNAALELLDESRTKYAVDLIESIGTPVSIVQLPSLAYAESCAVTSTSLATETGDFGLAISTTTLAAVTAKKYITDIGTFATSLSTDAVVSVTLAGDTYVVSSAIPPTYGTLSQLFNNAGGVFRMIDGLFSVSTGEYLGTNAWAGGMISTSTTAGAVNGPWIQMQFPVAKAVSEYGWSVWSCDAPRSWTIVGSNTAAAGSWVVLGSRTLSTPIADNINISTTMTPTHAYVYYRVIVTAIAGGSGGIQSTLLIGPGFYFKA